MKVLLVACFALLSAASAMPAVSQWTLHELADAIQNPNTDPLVLPYLENALNDMMLAIFHGVDQNVATVVLPAAVVEAITPVVPAPVQPEAVLVPVIDATEVKSSPLVQIILNINGASAAIPPAAVDTPVVPDFVVDTIMTPIGVVNPVVVPEAVGVAVPPETVGVAVLPETVGVAVLPETVGVAVPVNPIDHVMIEPLPINPVDVIAPVNPVAVIGAGTMIETPVGIHV